MNDGKDLLMRNNDRKESIRKLQKHTAFIAKASILMWKFLISLAQNYAYLCAVYVKDVYKKYLQ